MQIAALCPQIFDEEHYHCSRIAAKNHIQVWFFMLKLQSNLSVNPAFLNCLTNNITLHISTNQETAALEEDSSCRMRLDPQLLVKGCISSPVLDYRDSSRIHIPLLSDLKTILNKMQVYLFSFLFVLSFYPPSFVTVHSVHNRSLSQVYSSFRTSPISSFMQTDFLLISSGAYASPWFRHT